MHLAAAIVAAITAKVAASLQVGTGNANQEQDLRQQMNRMEDMLRLTQQQLSQVLVHAGKERDSTLVLAHNMGQMRDVQVGSTGMLMEVYRNQMQSAGHIQLPPAALNTQEDIGQQAALPRAVQEHQRKQQKLQEQQRQQQEKEVKARKQSLMDQMPGEPGSSAQTPAADVDVTNTPGSPAHDASGTQRADKEPEPCSDAPKSPHTDQEAAQMQYTVPGRTKLAWTEWLGRRSALSSRCSL